MPQRYARNELSSWKFYKGDEHNLVKCVTYRYHPETLLSWRFPSLLVRATVTMIITIVSLYPSIHIQPTGRAA